MTELDEHEVVSAPNSIRSMRRGRRWGIDHPTFVPPDRDEPANLTRWDGLARRVMVVGKPPTGSQVLTANQGTARHVYTDGHFPSVTTQGGTVVGYAAQWFGGGVEYTAAQAASMWSKLEGLLQQAWHDPGVSLLSTPATTGRDLWARTIPEAGWPVMSAAMQQVVRSSAGQGRMETFTHPEAPTRLRDLWEYDARIAYVALMSELPIGEPQVLTWPEAQRTFKDRFQPARYLVEWQAPFGWDQPGILPAHLTASERDWWWPKQSEGPSWCSAAELTIAAKHGWKVKHHEALLWPAQGRVLDTWRDRLLRVLQVTQLYPQPFRAMMRSAIRALLLHTLGAFHGAPHQVTGYGDAAAIPADAQAVRALGGERFTWRELQQPKWPEMVHPEWSATVWGRARARLLYGHRGATGALTVDPRHLVAMRTDAVYTSEPQGWELLDDQSPGRYRVEHYQWHAKQPRPITGPQLLNMRDHAPKVQP